MKMVMMKMTENKRFVCYFDNILKKWCVQNTDSLDMHYVADEPMGEEFAHLLNLYQQTLDKVEKENDQLKKELQRMYDVATLNKAIEVLENKYDKMLSDGSDEIKDAMRHTVLRCIEDLDELKDDITAR